MVALTPVAMLTTSSRPMSPRVASTTSGGRPKTVQTDHQWPLKIAEHPFKLTSLSDLVGTRVLIVKSSDEDERITSNIDLVVDGTLGEDRSLTSGQGVEDEPSAVLLDESGFHRSVHKVQKLGCSRVGVRGVHTARAEIRIFVRSGRMKGDKEVHLRHLTDSHSHAVGEQGGEVGDARDGESSTSTVSGAHPSVIIEQPLDKISISEYNI